MKKKAGLATFSLNTYNLMCCTHANFFYSCTAYGTVTILKKIGHHKNKKQNLNY